MNTQSTATTQNNPNVQPNTAYSKYNQPTQTTPLENGLTKDPLPAQTPQETHTSIYKPATEIAPPQVETDGSVPNEFDASQLKEFMPLITQDPTTIPEEFSASMVNQYLPLMKKAQSEQTSSSSSVSGKTSGTYGTEIDPSKDTPVKGPISQKYGVPVGYESSGHHGGIDIALPTGTPVPAAVNGEVLFAGSDGGFGNSVIVRGTDGVVRRYSHFSEIGVKVGDKVKSDTVVGKVGSTGYSTGPHLDFREYQSKK